MKNRNMKKISVTLVLIVIAFALGYWISPDNSAEESDFERVEETDQIQSTVIREPVLQEDLEGSVSEAVLGRVQEFLEAYLQIDTAEDGFTLSSRYKKYEPFLTEAAKSEFEVTDSDEEYDEWPDIEKEFHTTSELSKSKLYYYSDTDGWCSVACIVATNTVSQYGSFTDIELIILDLKQVGGEWLIDSMRYRDSLGTIQDAEFFF